MDRKILDELIADGADFSVKIGQKIYCAEPKICVSFSDSGAYECKIEGYTVTEEGAEEERELDAAALAGLFSGGELVGAGSFASFEEYAADKAFRDIDMAGLLKKYLPIADEFSLTRAFNDYDDAHPFGVYGISERELNEAAEGIKKRTEKMARSAYNRLGAEQKRELPPFEKLILEVREEYNGYAARRAKFRRTHGGEVFFADRFADGKTKYKYWSYRELHELYNAVDFCGSCLYNLNMIKDLPPRPDGEELEDGRYVPLKSALIRTETGFVWHCTTSGMLSKTFYFALTEESVGWLSGLKNDYDLCGLEDLAFYKDGKCIFSSCTHEGFHTDLSAKK